MKGIFLIYFLTLFYISEAQEIKNYIPFSITHKYTHINKTYKLRPLNLEQIRRDDSIQFLQNRSLNVASLQGFNFEAIKSSEIKQLSDSQSVWRVSISIPKARKIALKIENIFLPQGSRLFIYTENQQDHFLVFDASQSNYRANTFISKAIIGETLILEYNQIISSEQTPSLNIDGCVNFYKNIEANPGFGQSTDCEVNVACSEGDNWCKEAQSVVRILIQEGTSYSYCSGALINNTKQDKAPYILTAEHCGSKSSDEDCKYWKFDFNYQSESCQSPNSEAEIKTHQISGCEKIAEAGRISGSGSDFRLIKLLDYIPETWNVYYAGWDKKEYNTISGGGVSIHHPYGDIKKISTYTQDLTSSDANGGNESDEYWRTYWVATENGHGITEAGSSGSPLFNYSGLIIGTLSTGSSFCDNRKTSPDFYGKVSKHWDKNGTESYMQLKPWLDPLNSNVNQLGGIYGGEEITCKGKIYFEDFTIFPNPANRTISIGNDNLDYLAGAVFEIYDMNGKLISTYKSDLSIGVKRIDIHTLAEGVYILKVVQTAWVIQQKFVILR